MIQSLWYLDRLLYHAPQGLQQVVRVMREVPIKIYGMDKKTVQWCLGILLKPGELGHEPSPTDTDGLVRLRFQLTASAVIGGHVEYWWFDCLWNLYHDDVSYLMQEPAQAKISRVSEAAWLIKFQEVRARQVRREHGDLSRVEALLKSICVG